MILSFCLHWHSSDCFTIEYCSSDVFGSDSFASEAFNLTTKNFNEFCDAFDGDVIVRIFNRIYSIQFKSR